MIHAQVEPGWSTPMGAQWAGSAGVRGHRMLASCLHPQSGCGADQGQAGWKGGGTGGWGGIQGPDWAGWPPQCMS